MSYVRGRAAPPGAARRAPRGGCARRRRRGGGGGGGGGDDARQARSQGRSSSHVVVDVWRVLVALDVLPLDEVLDALLDHLEVGLEHPAQLVHRLEHEFLVL